jgi:hypothetical protein
MSRSRFLSVENKILVFDEILQYIFILSHLELPSYGRRLPSTALQNLKCLLFFMGHLNPDPIRTASEGPVRIQYKCGPILVIYKSLTDIWIWKLRLRPRSSFSGNTKMWFSLQCGSATLQLTHDNFALYRARSPPPSSRSLDSSSASSEGGGAVSSPPPILSPETRSHYGLLQMVCRNYKNTHKYA